MLARLLGNSRYLIIIAVIGSYLAAAIVIIYDSLLLIHILIELFLHPAINSASARQLILECIEVLDTFLLGTAFFIVALGLYELFIKRSAASPAWLRVRNLDDLKARLLGVIIVVMSVFFLEQVINWDGKSDILNLGVAEALVIGALPLTIKLPRREPEESNESLKEKEEGIV